MKKPNMNEARKRSKNSEVKYTNYVSNTSNFGKGKKYYVRTYGCQMNEHDSEKIVGMLESVGYKESKELENADIDIKYLCN